MGLRRFPTGDRKFKVYQNKHNDQMATTKQRRQCIFMIKMTSFPTGSAIRDLKQILQITKPFASTDFYHFDVYMNSKDQYAIHTGHQKTIPSPSDDSTDDSALNSDTLPQPRAQIVIFEI